MAATNQGSEGFPPIVTVALTAHLPGQNTSGPIRYVVFSDHHGPVGALWMASADGDEAVGWTPNRSHPDGRARMYEWRPRITVAQGRPHAPDFDPATEPAYSAEQFFDHWANAPHEGLTVDGPHELDGGSEALAGHLGWTRDGYPPIVTEDLSAHLAGQDTSGPIRYAVLSDSNGPIGALWAATALFDEACGWEPNPAHPDADLHEHQWRLRVTAAQARPHAPDFDPLLDHRYNARQFFDRWTDSPCQGAEFGTVAELDGGPGALAGHLGWSAAPA
jgi:hypothetical protein